MHGGEADEVVAKLDEVMRTKVQSQPKQEWSEEDSKRLQRITDFLWYNRKGDTDTIYQQEKDIDWLKSLRPQSRWKPSDEQIKALTHLFEGHLVNAKLIPKDYDNLKLLLEQLKKLKG